MQRGGCYLLPPALGYSSCGCQLQAFVAKVFVFLVFVVIWALTSRLFWCLALLLPPSSSYVLLLQAWIFCTLFFPSLAGLDIQWRSSMGNWVSLGVVEKHFILQSSRPSCFLKFPARICCCCSCCCCCCVLMTMMMISSILLLQTQGWFLHCEGGGVLGSSLLHNWVFGKSSDIHCCWCFSRW